MWSFRHWRRRRILQRSTISDRVWREAIARLPLLAGLDAAQLGRLREQATLFLHSKSLEPTHGLELTEEMSVLIALQAALPVLGLDLDWYRGWSSVVLYPDAFVSDFEQVDEAGVVHHIREARSGESWERGPLILSWADVESGTALDGYNVVIHELAHKLDLSDGALNGRPRLHPGMSSEDWSSAFGRAFDALTRLDEAGAPTPVDPYAAEAPEEFFAVVSEAFFEQPQQVAGVWPDVYRQLKLFYRQDPLARLGRRDAA